MISVVWLYANFFALYTWKKGTFLIPLSQSGPISKRVKRIVPCQSESRKSIFVSGSGLPSLLLLDEKIKKKKENNNEKEKISFELRYNKTNQTRNFSSFAIFLFFFFLILLLSLLSSFIIILFNSLLIFLPSTRGAWKSAKPIYKMNLCAPFRENKWKNFWNYSRFNKY